MNNFVNYTQLHLHNFLLMLLNVVFLLLYLYMSQDSFLMLKLVGTSSWKCHTFDWFKHVSEDACRLTISVTCDFCDLFHQDTSESVQLIVQGKNG